MKSSTSVLISTLLLLGACAPAAPSEDGDGRSASVPPVSSAESASSADILMGDRQPYLGTQVESFASTDAGGAVTEVGFVLPLSAIENARTALEEGEDPYGSDPHDSVRLQVPAVVKETTFIDHFQIDHNPVGHPPEDVYTTAHFDFHAYGISEAEQLAIDCSDRTLPAPGLFPDGFVTEPPGLPPEGTCVPQMGLHVKDGSSPELRSEDPEPFTRTMILGTYGGKATFIEPMATRDYLLTKEDFALAIARPSVLPEGKTYPSTMSAVYDEGREAYVFTFSDFR